MASNTLKDYHMKTSSIIGLAAAITAGILIFKSAGASGRLKGDVNNDGIVDATDAELASKHIVETIILTGEDFKAADMNNDGVISLADVVLIKRIYGG